MVFCNFLGTTCFSIGPPPVGSGGLVVFWPVLALGTLRNFRPTHTQAISKLTIFFLTDKNNSQQQKEFLNRKKLLNQQKEIATNKNYFSTDKNNFATDQKKSSTGKKFTNQKKNISQSTKNFCWWSKIKKRPITKRFLVFRNWLVVLITTISPKLVQYFLYQKLFHDYWNKKGKNGGLKNQKNIQKRKLLWDSELARRADHKNGSQVGPTACYLWLSGWTHFFPSGPPAQSEYLQTYRVPPLVPCVVPLAPTVYH